MISTARALQRVQGRRRQKSRRPLSGNPFPVVLTGSPSRWGNSAPPARRPVPPLRGDPQLLTNALLQTLDADGRARSRLAAAHRPTTPGTEGGSTSQRPKARNPPRAPDANHTAGRSRPSEGASRREVTPEGIPRAAAHRKRKRSLPHRGNKHFQRDRDAWSDAEPNLPGFGAARSGTQAPSFRTR